MKKILIICLIPLLWCLGTKAYGYVDHRGHNVDSLERVVAPWTPQMIETAPEQQQKELADAWDELMDGYSNLNSPKAEFYARKILETSKGKSWHKLRMGAFKFIGQAFWAREQFDSAAVYFKYGLEEADNLESQKEKDDSKSVIYGAIGNLYSTQGNLDSALFYYGRAGELFKKYDWYTSCAVLYHNMGETYLCAKDYKKAEDCYDESLEYAHMANDSLWIASALKGKGGLYLELGKTAKALRCLKQADEYFSLHEDEELRARLETMDFISQVLAAQKKHLVMYLVGIALILILLAANIAKIIRLRQAKAEKAEVAQFIEETIAQAPAGKDIKLNDREKAILKMLADGKGTSEMAQELCLSYETIKWYRKRLLAKFGVTTSSALVSEAIKKGFLG